MNFLNRFIPDKNNCGLPTPIYMSMHIAGNGNTPLIWFVIRSIIAAAGIFGTIFCFITSCSEDMFFHFSMKKAGLLAFVGWAYFSLSFALCEKKPKLSSWLSRGGVIAVLAYGLLNLKIIIAGVKNTANMFMAAMYTKYRSEPIFEMDIITDKKGVLISPNVCSETAMTVLILLICAVVCRGMVKNPNALLVFGATFPLAELCLFFGLVPNYAAFCLLLVCQCGALAAEITEMGAFEDRSADHLFAKVSAQSLLAAGIAMMICFVGACAVSSGFERSEEAESFRNNVKVYMRTFSWEKFKEDLRAAIIPSDGSLTHDGKLGNVDSVEFSGKNMLEVTLPATAGTIYLKGFTGTVYTGTRWDKGPAMPQLNTKISSQEFFSGRMLKYLPGYEDMKSKSVIVLNTGMSASTKYFPENAAGLLETDGRRRRFGVYFPDKNNLRADIITASGSLSLPAEIFEDESRLRDHAYSYCLDVPETFDCAEEFFEDYRGSGLEDELDYIRKQLASICEYSLESGKKPFGTDFAQWFLTENHKGSCTHFASAAVLLCRSRGIPARYCEGFIIKSDDIKSYTPSDGYVTVSVPDSRAHAWAEVYVDGFGWIIFEATPGYGNVAVTSSPGTPGEKVSEITEVTTEAPMYADTFTTITEESEEENYTETTVPSEEGYESTTVTLLPDDNGTETTRITGGTEQVQGGTGSSEYYEEISTDYINDGNNDNYGNNGNDGGSAVTYITAGSFLSEGAYSDNIPPSEISSEISADALRIIGKIFLFILICGAVPGAVLLRRSIIIAIRQRRISKAPPKAARDIYRMLLKLAAGYGIKPSSGADELPAELSASGKLRKEECKVIIGTALKARFGGGVTASEANAASEAYNALVKNAPDKSGAKAFIMKYLYCSDIYCK